MRINEIVLENFGPFLGEHRFELKDGVNLICGPNGSGKTFTFKAVLFGLYGGSAARIGPGVINKHHLDSGGEDAAVSLDIEFMGNTIKVVRKISSNGRCSTEIVKGKRKRLEELYSRLPAETAGFFLLDGEEVRQWMMSLGESRSHSAALLGLGYFNDVLDTFSTCLLELQPRIEQLKKEAGGVKDKMRMDGINGEIKKNLSNIKRINKEIKASRASIRELKKMKGLVRDYSGCKHQNELLEKETAQLDAAMKEESKTIRARMRTAPFSLVRKQLLNALDYVELMKQGTLAARIKEGALASQLEILDQILVDEKCICSLPLASTDLGKKEIKDLHAQLSDVMKKNRKRADVELWSTRSMMDMRSKVDQADKDRII